MSERKRVPAKCERCGRAYSRRSDQPQRFCSRACKYPLPETRFWAKVDKRGDDSCWLWTATKRLGYGLFSFNGSQWSAHRFAYVIAVGPLLPGLDVLHHCDVPACCNPRHLFLGTHDDNMADMAAKGRSRGQRKKLTPEAVRLIRSSAERAVDLGRQFGVHPSIISNVRAGRIWRRVHA